MSKMPSALIADKSEKLMRFCNYYLEKTTELRYRTKVKKDT